MLEFKNGQVVVDPDLMTIPEFKEIWDRDKTDRKTEAFAYISYIFNFNNPKSSYYNYREAERSRKIIERLFPPSLKNIDLKKDKAFMEASKEYLFQLKLSPYRSVVEIAKRAIQDVTEKIKASRTSIDEKLEYSAKIRNVLKSLKEAEELCEADEINSNVKGERQVRRREQ